MKKNSTRDLFEVALLTAGWFALSTQLYHNVADGLARGVPWQASLLNFFSYFTILTNLFLAGSLTLPRLLPGAALSRFLERPGVRSASLTYIVIVGAVYELLLRHLWSPSGLQWLADLLLHDVIPLGYFVYWVRYVPPARLRWRDALVWLIFPVGYFVYTMLRGSVFGHYPYPFFNVPQLGYDGVLLNAVFFAAGFIGTGALVVALDARVKAAQPARVEAGGDEAER